LAFNTPNGCNAKFSRLGNILLAPAEKGTGCTELRHLKHAGRIIRFIALDKLCYLFRNTREAFFDHERAKSELKALMPEDAKEAIGHGVRAKRSKSGAVSFEVLDTEAARASLQ